jgi:hypothetical protein
MLGWNGAAPISAAQTRAFLSRPRLAILPTYLRASVSVPELIQRVQKSFAASRFAVPREIPMSRKHLPSTHLTLNAVLCVTANLPIGNDEAAVPRQRC